MNKTQLNAAFKELRANGFIAKQNFSCCQGCASCEIADALEVAIDKGKDKSKIKGVVFYHHQDTATLRDRGFCYLSYGAIPTNKHGVIGLNTVEAGKAIVEILTRNGIVVEWNGTEAERIRIGEDRRKKAV